MFPHLSEDESLWVAAVQAQDEADGLKKFLDAGSKLLLFHAAGRSRIKDARLDYEFKEVLEGLRDKKGDRTTIKNQRQWDKTLLT